MFLEPSLHLRRLFVAPDIRRIIEFLLNGAERTLDRLAEIEDRLWFPEQIA